MATESTDNIMQTPATRAADAVSPSPTAPRPLSEAERERMQQLSLELRCLVCQNQSIADSNSGLAVDLRKQIAGQIRDGKSDEDIKQYMVERYGDFVLYKPAFSVENAALWIGPFLLLLVGIILAMRSIKQRRLAENDARPESAVAELPGGARLQEIEERYQRESKR